MHDTNFQIKLQLKKLIIEEIKNVSLIMLENKQSIKNLGYPDVIAQIFQNEFGDKRGYLLAKWYKEYFTELRKNFDDKDWFYQSQPGRSYGSNKITLLGLLSLYEEAGNGEEQYIQALRREGFTVDLDTFIFDPQETRKELFDEIKEYFFKESGYVFFNRPFIKDIIDGKITDLKPYANLPFGKASDRYESKKIKDPSKVIKQYDNGYRWINIGKRCDLVGKQMNNCGSAGVMSDDPDRVIITLYDKNMKPHVMVTYSPNQNRISGDEGKASSEVKEKYHDYIIDLAKILNAKLDTRSKSYILRAKSVFGDQIKSIVLAKDSGNVYKKYVVTLKNGMEYIFDGNRFIPVQVIEQLKNLYGEQEAKEELRMQPRYWSQQTKDIVGDSIIDL